MVRPSLLRPQGRRRFTRDLFPAKGLSLTVHDAEVRGEREERRGERYREAEREESKCVFVGGGERGVFCEEGSKKTQTSMVTKPR